MRRYFWLIVTIAAMFTSAAIAQDDGAQRIKKAIVGRMVLVKMDLPAIDSGIDFVLDDTAVTYNAANCDSLLKEYGVAVKSGTRVRITDVKVSSRGIEMDLDGGGMPDPDILVGNLKLVEPEPLAKSDREVGLERQSLADLNSNTTSYLRTELEYERQMRLAQDDRNRDAFRQMQLRRSKFINENRTKWGSKVVVVVHSRKESVKMRDMLKALAKYVELLPNEKPAE